MASVLELSERMLGSSAKMTLTAGKVSKVSKGGKTATGTRPAGTRASAATPADEEDGNPPPPGVPG